jgi:predicted lipid-binding transport protein (Tim44 family)
MQNDWEKVIETGVKVVAGIAAAFLGLWVFGKGFVILGGLMVQLSSVVANVTVFLIVAAVILGVVYIIMRGMRPQRAANIDVPAEWTPPTVVTPMSESAPAMIEAAPAVIEAAAHVVEAPAEAMQAVVAPVEAAEPPVEATQSASAMASALADAVEAAEHSEPSPSDAAAIAADQPNEVHKGRKGKGNAN